jgi:hypothetical protein
MAVELAAQADLEVQVELVAQAVLEIAKHKIIVHHKRNKRVIHIPIQTQHIGGIACTVGKQRRYKLLSRSFFLYTF